MTSRSVTPNNGKDLQDLLNVSRRPVWAFLQNQAMPRGPRDLPRLGVRRNGKSVGQKASFFCLDADHWRVIGLDTGYHSIGLPGIEMLLQPDCALPDELIDWIRDKLHQADDARGIILLSHHQYYSRFDAIYTKPAEQLAKFINRPVLWFWGHEHRLAIYEKYQLGDGISAFGRCIGHGGMPVNLPPDKPLHPACPTEFVDPRIYASDEDIRVGVNGFARLTLTGTDLNVDYVDVHGLVIFKESWTVDCGGNVSRRSAAACLTL